MEFEIHDGSGGGTNFFAVHPYNEANERFRLWQKPENVSLLIRDFEALNLDQTCVVGPCFETHLTEPLTIQSFGPGDPVACRLSGLKLLYCRMLCLLCHGHAQIACIYIYIIQKNLLLDRNPGNLRQRCAQFTHCFFAQSGSQLSLSVLPVRNALLKLFTTCFSQAKEPESPVIAFLGLHPSVVFEELQHSGQAGGIES